MKGQGYAPHSDDRRDNEVKLVNTDSTKGSLLMIADTVTRKQDTSTRSTWIGRPSTVDRELDPARNAAHVERMGTPMLISE
jgi:hypothetical protein